ncbi:MAG: anthranilate synthase component I, partial [Proteobacteria bacterium]|nr:anthranilate synthase component I [Pseudomonadota bacterium]
MGIFPAFAEFQERYASGKPQLMSCVLPADLETPVSSMIKLMQESPFHFLLESVEGGKSRARYSIIGLDPDLIWRVVRGKAEINRHVQKDTNHFEPVIQPPLEALRALIKECQLSIPKQLPPMAAGIFGYMGYDMVRQMERLPDKNPDPLGIPESIYIRPQIVVIFDSVKDTATVITPVWITADAAKQSAENAYKAGQKRIERVIEILHGARPKLTAKQAPKIGPFKANFDEASYSNVVKKAKEYIAAGDIFQ